MISNIVLVYLYLLVGELGDRFGSLNMSRSPSELRGWFSWPQLHDWQHCACDFARHAQKTWGRYGVCVCVTESLGTVGLVFVATAS